MKSHFKKNSFGKNNISGTGHFLFPKFFLGMGHHSIPFFMLITNIIFILNINAIKTSKIEFFEKNACMGVVFNLPFSTNTIFWRPKTLSGDAKYNEQLLMNKSFLRLFMQANDLARITFCPPHQNG